MRWRFEADPDYVDSDEEDSPENVAWYDAGKLALYHLLLLLFNEAV